MQFQKLQIYGFGKHRDEVIDFSKGMNILFGNNEAGKTTIYECILQILFGFPQKNHLLRSYEPKNGGNYGGMLSIFDEEFGAYTVERVGGKAGGNVRVQLDRGESGEEELLKKLLHGYGRADLEAIFAFSMHQLQALEKMNEDELNRTLLASGTTGVDQLTLIEKQLLKESNALFKKSGQNPIINKMIKDIQKEELALKVEREKLSKYEPKKQELLQIEQELISVQKQLEKANHDNVQIEQSIKNQPLLNELSSIKSRLQELEEVQFPAKGIQRIEQASTRFKQVEREVERVSKRGEELQLQLKEAVSKEKLQQLQNWIGRDEEWREWRAQRERMLAFQQSLESKIAVKEQLLGLNRSALKVDSTIANEAQLRKQLDEVNLSKQKIEHLQILISNEVTNEENRKSRMQKNKGISNELFMIIIGVIAVIGALVFKQWGVALAIIAMLALVLILNKKNKNDSTSNLNNGESPKSQLRQLKAQYEAQLTEINEQFHRMGITNDIEPEMYTEVFSQVRELQQYVIEQRQLDQQLDSIQQRIAERYEEGTMLLPHQVAESNLSAAIQQYLQDQTLLLNSMQQVQEQLRVNEEQLMPLTDELNELQQEIVALYNAANVEDLEPYYEMANFFEEKVRLQNRLSDLQLTLHDFNDEVEYTEFHLQQNTLALEQLIASQKALQAAHSKLHAEMNHLVTDERYSEMLQAQEHRKSELADLTKDWMRLRLVEEAIQQTLNDLKEDKLPKVMDLTTEFFQYLTGDRYEKIALDEEGFYAQTSMQQQFKIGELSQATREQAYLSLRFALAVEKKVNAPFPLLMDDPFVHFDTLRTAKVVQLLRKLQTNHQIIFFTCQERMKQAFEVKNIIEVEALQTKGD